MLGPGHLQRSGRPTGAQHHPISSWHLRDARSMPRPPQRASAWAQQAGGQPEVTSDRSGSLMPLATKMSNWRPPLGTSAPQGPCILPFQRPH
mmetsp:Transcript_103102/g.291551  ORF Transcript_103102/g.291551 Transcript_103102/m.291551 type:complete len:92 (-) Transcript_103102:1548-1823(-)